MSKDVNDKILVIGRESSRSVQRIQKTCTKCHLGIRVLKSIAEMELGLEISEGVVGGARPTLSVAGELPNYRAIWFEGLPLVSTYGNSRDRSYASSEMAALFVALVRELRVPVINPPKDLLVSMMEQDPRLFRGIKRAHLKGEIEESEDIYGSRYLVVKIDKQLCFYSLVERRIRSELGETDFSTGLSEKVLETLSSSGLDYWYVAIIVVVTKDGIRIRSFSTKVSRAIFGSYTDCIIGRILKQIQATYLSEQNRSNFSLGETTRRSSDEAGSPNWI